MTSATTDGTPDKTARDGPVRLELANGICLSFKDGSPMVINDLREQEDARAPQVPMIVREDRGGREEPNENDPAYIAARRKWGMDLGARTLRVLAAACLTVDNIPDDIDGPDSAEWGEQVTVVYELPLESHPLRRVAQWIFYHTSQDDMDRLAPMLMACAGPAEEEVIQALDGFRGDGQRSADTDLATNGSSGLGHSPDPAGAGNRAARRRASRGDS